MKRHEAESLFQLLVAIYDLHTDRVTRLAPAWIPALEEMDAGVVSDLVLTWTRGKGPPEIPTLPEFSQIVKIAARGDEPDPPACEVCADTGWVTVEKPVDMSEQVAPCPRCPDGRAREFPEGRTARWGIHGYWLGKQWEQVAPGEVRVLT
jgi:hypothetical protein